MSGSKDAIRIVPYVVSSYSLWLVRNVCHWHTAPCPIFAYREADAPLLCLRSASVGAKRTSTGCSAPYRGGSLSHKTTPVRAHRGFRLLTLASFQYRNTENEASCQRKRLSERLSFTSFCASGNDLFFRRGNERDKNAVKRR